MENRLKIKVIVREHGEGILQSSYVLERVFRYYCYSSISALASAHGFSLISSKWKKIAVICIKHTCTRTINLQFFLLFPVAQVVECPFRGTGGHGFDPGPRHIKLVKNSTSCSPLGTQTYGVEIGLVDPCQDNVTRCGIMSSVWDMILQ